jgi:hypothetical protein
MHRTVALLALAAGLAAPAAAAASEPATSELSEERLKTAWSGTVTSTFVQFVPNIQQTRCDQPFCDSHTFELKAKGDLAITVSSPGSASFVDLVLTTPDGQTTVYSGNEEDTTNKVVVPKAPVGTYKVAIWNNALPVLFDGSYLGRAELKLPPPPVED